MANRSGQVYGLTVLSPIIEGGRVDICHAMQIRLYLSTLARDRRSPFARLYNTYLARLAVMDDVVFAGAPAREEHLQSRYLVFESNFDGDLDTYLTRMAREEPEFVDSVWKHCVGYPGIADPAAFAAYMKKCQLTTTFFFADVNNQTLETTLRALHAQASLAHFIEKRQGQPAAEVQRAFGELLHALGKSPAPRAGGDDLDRTPQENRRHD